MFAEAEDNMCTQSCTWHCWSWSSENGTQFTLSGDGCRYLPAISSAALKIVIHSLNAKARTCYSQSHKSELSVPPWGFEQIGWCNLKQRGCLLLRDSWNSVSWGMTQVSGCAFWSGVGSCYWSETLQDHPMQERILSLSFDLVANILETGPVSFRCPLWKCWSVYRAKLLRHCLYRAS